MKERLQTHLPLSLPTLPISEIPYKRPGFADQVTCLWALISSSSSFSSSSPILVSILPFYFWGGSGASSDVLEFFAGACALLAGT